MSDSLVPCPLCARHVRVAEASCPFCNAALPRVEVGPVSTQQLRIGRAALFAFGATMAVASCASPSPAPLYGAPAGDMSIEAGADAVVMETGTDGGPPDQGFDSGVDAGAPDRGNIGPAYGLPPDAGADVGPDVDASNTALYGAPPWPDDGF